MLQAAEAITDIFRKEIVESYYMPSVNGKTPKGKLYDAYMSIRTDLAEVGLITRHEKRKKGKHKIHIQLFT